MTCPYEDWSAPTWTVVSGTPTPTYGSGFATFATTSAKAVHIRKKVFSTDPGFSDLKNLTSLTFPLSATGPAAELNSNTTISVSVSWKVGGTTYVVTGNFLTSYDTTIPGYTSGLGLNWPSGGAGSSNVSGRSWLTSGTGTFSWAGNVVTLTSGTQTVSSTSLATNPSNADGFVSIDITFTNHSGQGFGLTNHYFETLVVGTIDIPGSFPWCVTVVGPCGCTPFIVTSSVCGEPIDVQHIWSGRETAYTKGVSVLASTLAETAYTLLGPLTAITDGNDGIAPPDETETRAFISHLAPTDATFAVLTTDVSGSANFGAGLDLGWAIWQGGWGATTPSFASIGSVLASGTVTPGVGAGGVATSVSVRIPVVSGRVQFVLGRDPLTTQLNGGTNASPSVPVIVDRYPSFPVGPTADDRVGMSRPSAGVYYTLDYGTDPCIDALVVDTWSRTQSNFGVGEQITWDDTTGSSVDGTRGVIHVETGVTSNSVFVNATLGTSYHDLTCTFQVTADAAAPSASRYVGMGGDAATDGPWIDLATDGTLHLYSYGAAASVATAIVPTLPFKLRWRIVGALLYGKAWQASDPEPATWALNVAMLVRDIDVDVYVFADAGSPFTDDLTATYDNLRKGSSPISSQPVEDERVGTGDGATTAFFTRYPYNPISLEPEVDGIQVGFDPTSPSTGGFSLLAAPAAGTRVTVTYRRAA